MKNGLLIIIICFVFFINILPLSAADDVKTLFNDSLDATAKETGHLNAKMSNAGALGSAGLAISILLSLIGAIFLILMIYGGFIWMNSRGNDQEVERAKRIIINSVIALIIILAAYAITKYVGENLIQYFSKQ